MNPFKFILAALRSAGVFGLHLDGGGGGSAPASQTQVQDLPDWAKPYAKETLGKAQALTDINVNPYQTYGGEKVAGFSPMQQQSFQTAAGMQPSQLGAQAGQMAGAATMGALGTTYDPYQMGQFTAGRAAQYMNPFVEMAMEPQLREAQRASEIQRTADQAQATRAGAFGGGRQAIIEAERQRNLGTQLGDIRARGLLSAFEQAQQNFAREQQLREQSRQYGAGLGLQGLQTALTGAGQMGALGGQQFQQGMDINKLQNLYGTQQQQLEQQRLSQQYQDFMNQQRYPYQQLEFMSNILRGTPMGTVQTLYGGQPSLGQQIGAAGLGAYGLSKMFAAEGGMVNSYAEGGSVTSDDNVKSILSKLSKDQLMQSRQIAMDDGDMERVKMIDAVLAERASIEGGLGSAFNMLPQEQQENVLSAAGGGIVAFAGDEEDNDQQTGQLVRTAGYTPGSPEDYKFFLGEGRKLFTAMGQDTPQPAMTVAQRAKARADYLKELEEGAGESPYKKRLETIDAEQAALAGNLEKAKGLGALRAASALLREQGLARGIGAAGEAFAGTYEKAEAANRAENRALKAMEFNLLDAQRKERMGLNKEASAAMREADRDRAAANKARTDRLAAQARLAQGMATAAKPQRPTGTGGPKESKLPEQLAKAEVDFANDPSEANLKRVIGLRNAANYMGRQPGTERTDVALTAIDIKAGQAANEARAKAQLRPEYLELKTKEEKEAYLNNAAETARREFIRKESALRTGAPGAPAAAASAPVNANSTRAANPATVQGLPPGSVVRGNEVYDQNGRLIGHVR